MPGARRIATRQLAQRALEMLEPEPQRARRLGDVDEAADVVNHRELHVRAAEIPTEDHSRPRERGEVDIHFRRDAAAAARRPLAIEQPEHQCRGVAFQRRAHAGVRGSESRVDLDDDRAGLTEDQVDAEMSPQSGDGLRHAPGEASEAAIVVGEVVDDGPEEHERVVAQRDALPIDGQHPTRAVASQRAQASRLARHVRLQHVALGLGLRLDPQRGGSEIVAQARVLTAATVVRLDDPFSRHRGDAASPSLTVGMTAMSAAASACAVRRLLAVSCTASGRLLRRIRPAARAAFDTASSAPSVSGAIGHSASLASTRPAKSLRHSLRSRTA